MIRDFPPEIFDKILEEVRVGLTLVNQEGKILWSNHLAAELLGWDVDSRDTDSVLKCHTPELQKKVIHKINHCEQGREWHSVLKIKGRLIENAYSPIRIPNQLTGVMIITRDVTEREKMLEVINKAAVTDTLTGLYNRRFFEQVWGDFALGDKQFGVIMLDVNALKYVNDNFGHEAGDKLLMQAADIINNCVRQSDYVFRFGGDEFLVLLPDGDIAVLEDIKRRIMEQNRVPSLENPSSVYLSIGTCSTSEIHDAETVISCADQRMYEDKHKFYEGAGSHLRR